MTSEIALAKLLNKLFENFIEKYLVTLINFFSTFKFTKMSFSLILAGNLEIPV